MNETTLWIIFIAVGIGTFLIRLSFIQIHGKGMVRLDKYKKVLHLLAPAVLATLSIPAIVQQNKTPELMASLPALAAAAVTAGLAWRFRGVFWPLCLGMLTFWCMRYFLL
ncbi:AzlD domain-containing protein [Oceanimonas baumannii]|uniref:AzlD domain-containing protein n=1 Tax=Oceanimonas baumannii TaxID=129578 RepID=UPI001D18FE70|nr:AzlD domain-containing protein [Oceanimonas baumannii]MCC4262885.1 AzlD domain-containing protein [Oceanimonas baumannii]